MAIGTTSVFKWEGEASSHATTCKDGSSPNWGSAAVESESKLQVFFVWWHHYVLQEEQLQASEQMKLRLQHQLSRMVNVQSLAESCLSFFPTGDWTSKKGSRADKCRGVYQERAAADSGDETAHWSGMLQLELYVEIFLSVI